MTIPRFKTVKQTDRAVSQLQDNVAETLKSITSNPLVDGILLKDVMLTTNGTTSSTSSSGSFTAAGDLSGTSSSQTVIAIQGNAVKSGTLTASSDGYVLTWVNGASQYQIKPIPTQTATGTAGGDLSGTYPNPTVVAIQANAVQSGTLGASQDGYVMTWKNIAGSPQWEPLDFWQNNLMSGKRIQYWSGGYMASTGSTFYGMNCAIVSQGTTSASAWGVPSPFTLLNTTPRINCSSVASSAAIGIYALDFSSTTAQNIGFWRGNASGLGGFTIGTHCGIDALAASSNLYFFVGCCDGYSTGSPPTNYDWTASGSTTYNACGFAFNATASAGSIDGYNYKFVTTTAGFAPTVTDTGMACTRGQVMEFIMQCQPNGSNITWTVNNLTLGTSKGGTQSSTLPSSVAHMTYFAGYYIKAGGGSTNYFSVLRYFSES